MSNRWGYGLNFYGASNINLISDNIVGSGAAYASVGVCIQATGTSSIIPVVVNLTAVTANYCGYGFVYGPYLQGVTISQSNFTGDAVGIYVPSGQAGNDQLVVNSTQINASLYDIQVMSALPAFLVSGNTLYINSNSGGVALYMANAANYAITRNSFIGIGTSQNGLVEGSWQSAGGVITGNQFYNFTTGIWLQSNSRFATVGLNSYSSVNTNTLNNGTNNTIIN